MVPVELGFTAEIAEAAEPIIDMSTRIAHTRSQSMRLEFRPRLLWSMLFTLLFTALIIFILMKMEIVEPAY